MTVHLTKDVYFTIIASCYRFANPTIIKNEWAEVQGALYGFNKNNEVYVQEAVPLNHLSHIAVEMHEEDYVALAAYEERMASANYFQVGWYHSHPDIKLMLSLEDVKTQAGLQAPNALSIALVFNHVYLMEKEGDLGFKIYRLDDPSTIEMKYHEIPWKIVDGNEGLQEESRKLLYTVQKHLTGARAIEIVLGRIDKTIKKINSEIFGLKSYINTLAMEGKQDMIQESYSRQKDRIAKLIDSKDAITREQLSVLAYLELKETSKWNEEITGYDQKWREFMASLPEKFEEIRENL